MLVFYEREKIYEDLGSDSSKLQYSQKYNVDVEFADGYSRFFTSGIFQIKGGPPVLILPWFLKGNLSTVEGDIANSEISFFDFIKNIKYYLDSSASLYSETEEGIAFEIVTHSFLKRLHNFVLEIITNNYFLEVEEEVNTIKGKWNISRDLMRSHRPIKFDCTYSNVGKNARELRLIKGVCLQLKKRVRSFQNRRLLDEVLRSLHDVDPLPIDKNVFSYVAGQRNAITEHSDWDEILKYITNFVVGNSEIEAEAGFCFKLPVDKFFEDIIFYVLEKIPNIAVTQQVRTDLLGGSSWVSQDGRFEANDKDVAKGKVYSIPDIFVEVDDYVSVLECKYKPLRVKFINEDSGESLKSISREDRNQILSFVLSVQPSIKMKNKKVEFNLVFPSVDVEDFGRSALVFPYSKFTFDHFKKNIIHRNFKDQMGSGSVLKINFIGLNVAAALNCIRENKVEEFAKKFLNHISSKEITEDNILNPETDFQEKLQKRVALASIIVKEAEKDKTLGRTKLAKVIFLSDSLYNLDLGLNYERAAAGPFDKEGIVESDVSIEKMAGRSAFFKTVHSKRTDNGEERYSYIPGNNIQQGIDLSEDSLVASSDAIRSLVKEMIPLNTEQSEIVATLFGCWNDLIFLGNKEPSDEEIIEDFLNNWHKSKMRFQDRKDVLVRWISWMRRKNIVPSGNRQLTNTIAS